MVVSTYELSSVEEETSRSLGLLASESSHRHSKVHIPVRTHNRVQCYKSTTANAGQQTARNIEDSIAKSILHVAQTPAPESGSSEATSKHKDWKQRVG